MPPKKQAKWETNPDSKKFQRKVSDILQSFKNVELEIQRDREERRLELAKLQMEILNAGGGAGDRIIKEPEMALFSLEHTSNCDVRNCGFPGCCKMRIIIDHAKAHWNADEPNNCIICKNFAKVVRKHTQYCFAENCQVHNCNILKSKILAIESQISAAERNRREAEMAERAKEAGLIL